MRLSMRARYILLGLILVGLAIKLAPPLSHGFIVNFDSIYHARIGQTVAETGWIPSWDYAAGGRPHLYPPLYHLILGYGSIISGVPVLELIKYILPFVSALLVLPVFFLMRAERGLGIAITGASLVAFNPIVTAQSYDSPQLFGLFLLPLIAYCLLRRNYPLGGVLLGITLLFNYFITITIIAVMLGFSIVRLFRGGRGPLIHAGLIITIGLGLASPWLLLSLSRWGECFNPTTAVVAIANEGMGQLLLIAPFVVVICFGILYALRGRGDDYSLFWKVGLGLGTAGFLVSLIMPQLHPYDMLLLFGFSLVFVIPEVVRKREKNLTIVLIMLVLSIFAVLQVVPALSDGDLAAAYWVKDNVGGGTILANPEISGVINTITMSRPIQTEFDLFLECIPDSRRWEDMYLALSTHDTELAGRLLDRYGVDYVIVGARDIWNYHFDTNKFKDMDLKIVFRYGDSVIYKRTGGHKKHT